MNAGRPDFQESQKYEITHQLHVQGNGIFTDGGTGGNGTSHEDPMLNAIQGVLDSKQREVSVDEVSMSKDAC